MQTDIYARLKDDHAAVASLLQRLAATTPANSTQRRALFSELKHSLIRHSQAESETFYAALRQHEVTRPLIQDSQHEHQRIEALLDELERTDVSQPQWSVMLQSLKELVEHHVHEEEGQVFPQATTVLTAQQADELGQRFAQAKGSPTLTAARDTAETSASEATGKARELGERARHQAEELTEQVKERGRSLVGEQQQFIGRQLGSMATALHKTAEQLDAQDQKTLATYTNQAADGLERFSHSLQQQDMSALLGQVEDFARRQPTVFIGSAAILGFLAARFLKSSGQRRSSSADVAS